MAGHSHWAGIKHKKERVDKFKSKMFSKLSREITVAAKLGDKDPDINPRLRSAIQAARSANMPKENILRAIEKSEYSQNNNFEEIRYEGFGPFNVACIVDVLTDNKNRTASNLRTIFHKNGGSLGTKGSAVHNFKQIGVIKIDKNQIDENSIYDYAVQVEAEDCLDLKEYFEIHCKKNELYEIKKKLELKLQNFLSTGIEWRPLNFIKLDLIETEEILNLLNNLEDDDDVQKVYTNNNYSK